MCQPSMSLQPFVLEVQKEKEGAKQKNSKRKKKWNAFQKSKKVESYLNVNKEAF